VIASRSQFLSNLNVQQQLLTSQSLSTTQQVSVPQSPLLSLPSGGGFGQDDLLPLPVRVPLTNFDLGVDDGLRGKDAAPAPDGMGASILDQLFREWPATAVHQSDAQSQSSDRDATPAALAETHSQTSTGAQTGVVPAPEQHLFKFAVTGEESDSPGSALNNDGQTLAAERVEGGASAAALNAEGNERVSASLALLALACPVGRELRAKQQRRPGLESAV